MQDTCKCALDLSFRLQCEQLISPACQYLFLRPFRLYTYETICRRACMLLLGLRAVPTLKPLIEPLLAFRNKLV